MKCPKCENMETKVVDSRIIDDGTTIRRRRECEFCWYRFTTFEKVGITYLFVIKRDWTKQIYDRDKLINAITLAFAKRKVPSSEIENMVSELEMKWSKLKEIKSSKLWEDVLEKLKEKDPVAYIRFASVYKQFDSLDDFKKIILE